MYRTFKKPQSNKGYNKEKRIYKGTFITNEYVNHTYYRKLGDKWYFNYSKFLWDVNMEYEKYPEDNTSFVLQSDLLTGETIDTESIKGKSINIKDDLFDKQKKGTIPVNWEELNPILPDFITTKNKE